MLTDLPLTGSVIAFAVSAVLLVVVGVRFTKLVDALADRTGIGEALAGAVLVGAVPRCRGWSRAWWVQRTATRRSR